MAAWATIPAGCTGAEPVTPPAEPGPGREAQAPAPDPAQPAERGLRSAEDPKSAPEGPELTLVGVVHEGGQRVCDDQYKEFWVGRHWAAGFVPLAYSKPALGQVLAAAKGKVVVVRGVETRQPPTQHGDTRAPTTRGECPIYQMRSDWEVWPDGIRKRRAEATPKTLHVAEVREVQPLVATAATSTADLVVHNPFATTLRDGTLVAHYEGCYGKPGSTADPFSLGELAAGAVSKSVQVPLRVDRDGPRARDYRLDSVELTGVTQGGRLDLDVDVGDLGISAPCPDRNGKKSRP